MKNQPILWLVAIVLTASFYGCTKHDSFDSEFSITELEDISKEFLVLTQEDFNTLTTSLTVDFEGKKGKEIIAPQKELSHEEILALPAPEPVDMNDLINEQNEIVAKYPQLNNFTSMLDIYHQALLLDKTELESFVSRHSSFLAFVEEFDHVMLSVPKHKAALLNPEGLIKVDEKIIMQGGKSIKIIENGDADKIPLLKSTKKSNDLITVHDFSSNRRAGRIISVPGVKYHPTYPQYFAVGYIDFIDWIPVERGFHYKIGTELATFFRGQVTYVSTLNLTATVWHFDAEICYYEGPFNDYSNTTYASNTWGSYVYVIYWAGACAYNSSSGSVQVVWTTDFLLVYANQFPWAGSL